VVLRLLGTAGLCLVGCGPPIPTSPATPAPAPVEVTPSVLTPAPGPPIGDPQAGRRLFAQKGCGGCHTIQGVATASGIAGPNLTNIGLRPTLAGEAIPNTPAMMVRWLLDPALVKPGTTMPNVGLSQSEAQDLAAFLFSQPYTSR
jgi:cytochrome c